MLLDKCRQCHEVPQDRVQWFARNRTKAHELLMEVCFRLTSVGPMKERVEVENENDSDADDAAVAIPEVLLSLNSVRIHLTLSSVAVCQKQKENI